MFNEHGFEELFSQEDVDYDYIFSAMDEMDLSEEEAQFFDAIGKFASNAVNSVGKAVKDVAKTVEKGLKTASKWVVDAGKSFGKWLNNPGVKKCLGHTGMSLFKNFTSLLPEEDNANFFDQLEALDIDYENLDEEELAELWAQIYDF